MSLRLPLGKVEWKPLRDIAAGTLGVAGTIIDWGARGPFALLSFVGPALKKGLISQDTPKTVKFLGGVAALIAGGVTGLLGYLAAAPRGRGEADVLATRSKVAADVLASPTVKVTTSTPLRRSPSQPATSPRDAAPRDGTRPPAAPRMHPSAATIQPQFNTPAAKTGEQATAEFFRLFDSLLVNPKAWTISAKDGAEYQRWMGQTVRIVKAESESLKALIDELYAELPAAEAKKFHDSVAERLTHMTGSEYETQKKFPELLRHLKQGCDADILASVTTPDIDATHPGSAAKTGVQTADEFLGIFESLLENAKAWTISEKDGPEFSKWLGDTVRIVKAETDGLKAQMDKAYADLPASEAQAFHDRVAERITNLPGSRYEKEKKFADLLRHLKQGLEASI